MDNSSVCKICLIFWSKLENFSISSTFFQFTQKTKWCILLFSVSIDALRYYPSLLFYASDCYPWYFTSYRHLVMIFHFCIKIFYKFFSIKISPLQFLWFSVYAQEFMEVLKTSLKFSSSGQKKKRYISNNRRQHYLQSLDCLYREGREEWML